MEGSSSSSSLGLDMSARPMASICCSPPGKGSGQLSGAFLQAGKTFVDPGQGFFDLFFVLPV